MSSEQRRLLTVVVTPLFMSLLAVSSVNVVLPAIQAGIDATDTQIQWVLSGYTLVFGVILVAAGRAGDVYGRGRLFILGLVLFGLGCLLSGLATTGPILVAARIAMGLGSGILGPQPIGFIQTWFEGQHRATAFGAFGAVAGVSVAAGPLMGGGAVALLGEELGWRMTFLINVPIVVAAIVLALRWIPSPAFERRRTDGHADLDPVGVILFTLAVLCIMLPFLERALGPAVFALVPVGIALLAVWVWWERRYRRQGRDPMVNLGLFQTPSFANGTLLVALLFTGTTSTWVVLAIYLQNGQGATPMQAALVGLPAAVASGVAASVAGRHVLRLGRPLVATGLVISLVSILSTVGVLYAHQQWGLSPWWLAVSLTLIGVGQGMVVSPNTTLTLTEVPGEYSGSAGGVIQTGQRVGTAIGIAMITGAFFVLRSSRGWDTAAMAAFAIIGVMIVLALAVAVWDIVTSRRAADAQASAT